jgi:gas vesicle protein
MKNHATTGTLVLLGGALLGGAAMYLLDPDKGGRRRRRIATAAGDAGHALGEKWDDLASHAKDLSHRVVGETTGWQKHAADSVHALADQAREITHNLTHSAENQGSHLRDLGTRMWDRVRSAADKFTHLGGSISDGARHARDDASDRAHEWGHWLKNRAAKAAHQTGDWIDPEERHDGIGAGIVTSTAVGCCAVGAGLMYFLDPNRGHARRTYVRDKTGQLLRNTSHTMRAMGKDIGDRARRFLYGSRGTDESSNGRMNRIDSAQLVSQIRAELGQFSPYANQIQLMTDADGTVTLTGTVPQAEIDGLLTLLHSIPGVTHVINRLETKPEAGNSRQHPVSAPLAGSK